MNLKESASAACIEEPVLMNYVDDSLLRAADESCNISIKDEPLDITECSLKDFKSELEDFDVDIKDEPFVEEKSIIFSDSIEINVGNILGKNTSGIINKSLNNITNNKDDGQEETFQRARETVNKAPSPNKEVFNKTLTNSMVISSHKSSLTDHTYSLSNSFREHDNCFTRKTFLKKVSFDEANEHTKTNPNQTVYNHPITDEIELNILNNGNKNANNSKLKSSQSLQFSNDNSSRNSNFRNKSPTNDNSLKSMELNTDVRFPFYNKQLQKNDGKKDLFSAELSSEIEICRRLHRCNLCSYVSTYVSNLEAHKISHILKKPILKCNKCSFRSTKRALEAHKKKHKVADPRASSSKIMRCSICSFTTNKQQILKNHEAHHRKTKVPIVKCFYCSHRYTRYLLHTHMKNVHPGQRFRIGDDHQPDKVQIKPSFESSSNLFSTTEENNVEEHLEEYNSESAEQSPQFKATQNCSLCSFSTNDKVTLRLHLRQHQFEPIKRTPEFGRITYDCRMCSYSGARLCDINCHINSHRKNLPIRKCPKCEFRSTQYVLRYHIRICKNTPKNREISERDTSKVRTSQNTVKYSESNKVSSEKSCKNTPKNREISERDASKVRTSQNTVEYSESNKVSSEKPFSTRDKQLNVKEQHFCELIKDSFGQLIYHCKLCSYSNQGFISMIRHMNWHKRNVPVVKCPYCDFKSFPEVLVCHVRKCGSKTKVQEEKHIFESEEKHLFEPVKSTDSLGFQRLFCKMCSYANKRFRHMMAHIESHKRNEPIVSCFYCDFKSTLTTVEYHRKRCKLANEETHKHLLEKAAEKL